MHQRIGQIGLHHLRITRHPVGVQPVVHTQVGRQLGQGGQQKLLHDVGRGPECGRRQNRRIDRPQVLGQSAGHHQTAHAVTQQNQWPLGTVGTLARGVNHPTQIGLQAAGAKQVTASARRMAVALLVVSPHEEAPVAQMVGQFTIAPGVLAQAVHQQHGAQRWTIWRGPVVNGQCAGLALQFCPAGLYPHHRHGMRAMTSATEAVSFLA